LRFSSTGQKIKFGSVNYRQIDDSKKTVPTKGTVCYNNPVRVAPNLGVGIEIVQWHEGGRLIFPQKEIDRPLVKVSGLF
jgi:hypothetical protein